METIYIKNMVCDRCINSVRGIFQSHDIHPQTVKLGEVMLSEKLNSGEMALIDKSLQAEGFEIIDAGTPVLVLKIKSALIEVYNEEYIPEEFKLSQFLTQKFPYDYSHLSRVFSQHEKGTIEQYSIKLRIEKAKELLTYKESNISEVAYRLGYASAAHFSRQFKKIVGVSPSEFRRNPQNRNSLEDI